VREDDQVDRDRPQVRPVDGGAVQPGGAAAVLIWPQPQARRSSRCSVTRTLTGTSRTCRTIIPAGVASPKPAPQPAQVLGPCSITSSGSATRPSPETGPPGCIPGRRPDPPRRGRGGLPPRSADGGSDEFPEL
jgi:hypothetical protein